MSATNLFLRLIGSGYDKTPIIKANSDWTVKKLYEAVGSLKHEEVNAFMLMCVDVVLDLKKDGKKLLKEYRLLPNDGLIFCERSRGGSGMQELPGNVSLTKKPCCVTCEDDETQWRVELECGHTVAVNTVKRICENTLGEGKYKIVCPGSNCDQELTLAVVRHILSVVMTERELNAILDRMNENYLRSPNSDIQQCQVCGVNWKKDFKKRRPGDRTRVMCNTCSRNKGRRVEYCWECRREWKRGSYKCGYPDCNWEEDQILTLQRCGTKTIGDVSGCPIIRACPRCGNLIYHEDRCKHMTCKCGCSFCFVCLKKKGYILWDCSRSYCPIAPRQDALPTNELNLPVQRPSLLEHLYRAYTSWFRSFIS